MNYLLFVLHPLHSKSKLYYNTKATVWCNVLLSCSDVCLIFILIDICHLCCILALMVINTTNINKRKNHLSSQIIEHKKDHDKWWKSNPWPAYI